VRARTAVFALILMFAIWFMAFQDGSVAAATQRAADLFDSRPTRSILIVGNSRTFFNHMPSMLRKIADSARSRSKFQVETSAYPAATFKTHWEKARTRNLLEASWDDVILQAESGAQATRQGNDEFLLYGAKLAAIGTAKHAHSRLVVGWAYDPRLYDDRSYIYEGFSRSDHVELIRSMHAKLASDANLGRIDVVGPWELVRRSSPSIQLTTDGNHPSVAGTYLYALAAYASISNGTVEGVTYVPEGLDPKDAKTLREAVNSFPLLP
jgi:hypothetical protein